MSIPPFGSILDHTQLSQVSAPLEYLHLIHRDVATQHQTCVLACDHKQIDLVTTNINPDWLKQIISTLGGQWYKVTTHYTDPQSFEICLWWYDQAEHRSTQIAEELQHKQHATGKEAITLISELFEQRQKYSESDFIYEIIRLAYQSGASDLHFQNEEQAVVVRLRIDGILYNTVKFDHLEFKKYLLKIKFMSRAKMNVDYLPQDARFGLGIWQWSDYRTIDVRLSLIPWLDGESIAMRFLDPVKWLIKLHDIGFVQDQYQVLQDVLDKMSWMVIITGPTWSGKTTTLYSMIGAIDHKKYKIITLEDPIEYHLAGIQQSQIDEYRWYTFESWLKAILRHDPDVIMVWEIRTLETAETAIAAAMTGHLVLCTLHTNSAIEAIQRLINMGVKPYTLIWALNVIVGQKLIHRTQADCRLTSVTDYQKKFIEQAITHLKTHLLTAVPSTIITESANTDLYQGRLMVAEVLRIDDTIRQMIVENATLHTIQEYVLQSWYMRIVDCATIALCQHQTSREEVVRLM